MADLFQEALVKIDYQSEPFSQSSVPFCGRVSGLMFDSDNLIMVTAGGEINTGDERPFQCRLWLKAPFGLALTSDGNFVICDAGTSHCVKVFSPQGQFLQEIGAGQGNGPGQLDEPVAVTVDLNDNLVVADKKNNRLQVFSSTGQFIRIIGAKGEEPGNFCEPLGLCIDREGKIIVCDSNNDRVQVFSNQGEFLFMFGGEGDGYGDGQLITPRVPILTKEGDIIIVEQTNRVQVFG